MTTIAASYARVSSEEQRKSGFSLGEQTESNLKYANEHGHSVPSDLIFEESHTGTELSRPKIDRLIELAQEHRFEVLILYCMDRLTRGGAVDQLVLERTFKRAGVRIEYVTEQYEDSASGELNKQIRAAVAQFEHAMIKERTTRGKTGRAKQGKYIPGGRVSHYGYRYVRKSPDDPGHVEIEPNEAEIVKLIFYLYTVERLGTRAIAQRLTQQNVSTRADNDPDYLATKYSINSWWANTVLNILRYEGYAGTHRWNKATYVKPTEGAKTRSRRIERPLDEQFTMTIPAIIDRDMWDAAQERRLVLYSPDGKTKKCHRSLRRDVVDAVVWNYVYSVLMEPDKILAAYKERENASSREVRTLHGQLEDVEQQIVKNDAGQKELLDMYFDKSPFSREVLDEKAAQLRDANVSLKQTAKSLRAKLDRAVISQDRIDSVFAWCARVREGLNTFAFEDKRTVVNLLEVEAVIIRGATREDDTIIVSGILPTMRLSVGPMDEVVPNALLQLAIHC